MNKRVFLLLLTLTVVSSLFSQTNNKGIIDKKINWGLRIGFNSSFPSPAIEDDDGLVDASAINKVGYMAETFFRVNVNRFFLQPEFNISYLDEELVFRSDEYRESLNVDIFSSDLSAIVGYNAVKYDVFAFNILLGTKMKYLYRVKTNPVDYASVENDPGYYNLYITAGVGVTVHRMIFDFRYNIALMKNDINVQNSKIQELNDLRIYKRADILSFSVGIIF